MAKLFGTDSDAASGPWQHFLMERNTYTTRTVNRSGMSATSELLTFVGS